MSINALLLQTRKIKSFFRCFPVSKANFYKIDCSNKTLLCYPNLIKHSTAILWYFRLRGPPAGHSGQRWPSTCQNMFSGVWGLLRGFFCGFKWSRKVLFGRVLHRWFFGISNFKEIIDSSNFRYYPGGGIARGVWEGLLDSRPSPLFREEMVSSCSNTVFGVYW